MRFTHTLPTVLMIGAALIATIPPQQEAPTCDSKCRTEQYMKDAQAIVDAQIATHKDCQVGLKPKVIPERVMVRGATRDKSVVWTVTFDEAWSLNKDSDKDNDVVVIGGCY